jgi:hypothetical protein
MRAIKINSNEQTVEVIDFEGDFRAIQKEIDVDCFTVVELNGEGDTLFVDDEGLFKETNFFVVEGYPQPLAGHGLILGTDLDSGESRGTDMEVPEVKFLSRMEVMLMSKMGAF